MKINTPSCTFGIGHHSKTRIVLVAIFLLSLFLLYNYNHPAQHPELNSMFASPSKGDSNDGQLNELLEYEKNNIDV
ncbi:MAG: hypothetical protein HQK53_14170, partial [Oligoflexia bacterium]|nr:hypothetical protein [Oligoflexia bacterium]